MTRAGISSAIRLIGAVTAVSVVMMLFAACRPDKSSIPDIPAPDDSDIEETSASTSGSSAYEPELMTLNVALPYQESTVRYLASMYYAKKNKLWDSSYNGMNFDLESLSSVNPDFIINTTLTSDEGMTSSALKSMEESGIKPDLFLAADINDAVRSGLVMPVNEFTGSDNSYDNDRIYSNCAMQCIKDGVSYGIPHTMSAEIIVGNSDYIPASGRPPVVYSCTDLEEYLTAIKTEYPGVIPLMSASDLFPYIGSTFNHGMRTSYMLNEEYKSTPASAKYIFNDEMEFIGSLYENGFSADRDQNGASPVYSRQCALWVSSSASLKTWEAYYPSKIYTIFLPSYDADNQSPANVHVYPLCVRTGSENGKLACDFASFISFDPDAQMLIQRLELRSGFFPVTRNSALWDSIDDDPSFGQTAYILRQILDNAEFVPADDCDPVFSATKNYFKDFGAKDDYSLEELYGN